VSSGCVVVDSGAASRIGVWRLPEARGYGRDCKQASRESA
jgi:hypothetical protein